MTPNPVFSAGVALYGSRPVSCCLFAVFAQRSLGIPNSAVPSKHLHLFPTSHGTDEVCCISCLRTWHNHLTHHSLDFSLSCWSPPSPSFIPIRNFWWFFVKYFLDLSLSLHSGPHISHLDSCYKS